MPSTYDKDIQSYNFEELSSLIESLGEKKFRAKQIYEWIHVKLVSSFDEMTNLSASFREKLKEDYILSLPEIVRFQESKEDGTRKYLFKLRDGNMVETVFMRYHHGNSVCISSQVGCAMGCKFCASTLDGLERSLTPSEMLGQIYQVIKHTGERVSNVVVMGMGEPLTNYDNLVRFIELFTDEHGQNISQRNLTVSTCGIVPNIIKLADLKLQITLAISLHATTNDKRKEIMPVANTYSLDKLMDACKYYFDTTGRRITFEYALIGGVNDTAEDAAALARLAGPLSAHINLIPVNPVVERGFTAPDISATMAFKNKLEKKRINVTIRREMGRDIDGACGQLRRRHIGG